MTDDLSAAQLLDALRKSELLSDAQSEAAIELYRQQPTATGLEFAKALIAGRLVTRFQAERLLSGRTRGYQVGEYVLLDVLGMGGIGTIYLSVKRGDDLLIALKTLSKNFENDPGLKVRLEMEYAAGRRMDHTNVITTLDRGVSGGLSFLATKYFAGITLHELVATQGTPPWKQACDFIRQSAAGLTHVHARGVIHRDVKPENLLVSKAGRIKLMDFGLALLKERREEEFSLAMLFGQDKVGTADYVAPEQADDSQQADERSDIYSLGCTFYALLTGNVPFPDPSQKKKLAGHRKGTPKPISEFRSDLPADVITACERMMAKAPADRFQSAAEIEAALAPHSQSGPVTFSLSQTLKRRRAAARKKSVKADGSFAQRSSVPQLTQSVSNDFHDDEADLPDDSNDQVPVLSDPDVTQSSGRQRPVLATLTDVKTGAVHPLTQQRVLLGQSEACDLRIDSPAVSDRHVEFRLIDDRWRLIRHEEGGGVQVDGRSCHNALLTTGDVLTLTGGEGAGLSLMFATPREEKKSVPLSTGQLIGAAIVIVIVLSLLLWLGVLLRLVL